MITQLPKTGIRLWSDLDGLHASDPYCISRAQALGPRGGPRSFSLLSSLFPLLSSHQTPSIPVSAGPALVKGHLLYSPCLSSLFQGRQRPRKYLQSTAHISSLAPTSPPAIIWWPACLPNRTVASSRAKTLFSFCLCLVLTCLLNKWMNAFNVSIIHSIQTLIRLNV